MVQDSSAVRGHSLTTERPGSYLSLLGLCACLWQSKGFVLGPTSLPASQPVPLPAPPPHPSPCPPLLPPGGDLWVVGPRTYLAVGAPGPLSSQLTDNGYMVLDTFATTTGQPMPDAQQVHSIRRGLCRELNAGAGQIEEGSQFRRLFCTSWLAPVG